MTDADLRQEFAGHVSAILGYPAEDATEGRARLDDTVWCRVYPPGEKSYRTVFTTDKALRAQGDWLRAYAALCVSMQMRLKDKK